MPRSKVRSNEQKFGDIPDEAEVPKIDYKRTRLIGASVSLRANGTFAMNPLVWGPLGLGLVENEWFQVGYCLHDNVLEFRRSDEKTSLKAVRAGQEYHFPAVAVLRSVGIGPFYHRWEGVTIENGLVRLSFADLVDRGVRSKT